MVIFIDEVDSLLSLSFPMDDFFALLRAHYNSRVDHPGAKRLTFALFGVAAPSDLIQDKQRTPFNIGQAIPLGGFEWPEAQVLALGLGQHTSQPDHSCASHPELDGGTTLSDPKTVQTDCH